MMRGVAVLCLLLAVRSLGRSDFVPAPRAFSPAHRAASALIHLQALALCAGQITTFLDSNVYSVSECVPKTSSVCNGYANLAIGSTSPCTCHSAFITR